MTNNSDLSKFIDLLNQSVTNKFGIDASIINIDSIEKISIPEQIRDEIPTRNEYGYMKIELDEFAAELVEYAGQESLPILELGSAYGYTAHKILEKGAKLVVNDLSYEHLAILLQGVKRQYLQNLTIKAGRFPEINFPNNSFGAVLTSRMMHFLTPQEASAGFNKIYDWLVPGGKFFFIVITPYHFTLRDKFLPTYNKRFLAKESWPGRVESNKQLAGELALDVPDSILVFDVEELQSLLPQYGFRIDKIKRFDYKSHDSDSKGHVGLVATKI
ncbi:MAG: class I SAM-dependent methyltransferase [Rickettsiaceae bacterium]|nr:class I SAM-dependent methyltransferase [Rickettsiaceae bacterium]MDP4832326.1 class I SAM-dependent methyltransferase [Rickettsiaceae bacterium]